MDGAGRPLRPNLARDSRPSAEVTGSLDMKKRGASGAPPLSRVSGARHSAAAAAAQALLQPTPPPQPPSPSAATGGRPQQRGRRH